LEEIDERLQAIGKLVLIDEPDDKRSSKAYGDRLLINDLTVSLPPGSIVGVIGPNGAGKTTLLKMIIGPEQPDRGLIRIGDTVKTAYAVQSRTLDPDKTVFEEISGGADLLTVGGRTINTRA
jgi:ATPase subunit of ABC transporter with duplicated ATPase domains